MSTFKIGSREISERSAPLVIPEVGINHEGSVDKSIALVDACADAGAEVVKFQCHITESEMIPTDMTPGDISSEKLWDIIKRCELSEPDERKIKEYCNQKGMIYLSTPFSREAVDRLERMNVPAYKIGSGECNNLPLVEYIAKIKKPVILSTGMNDLKSITRTVNVFKSHGTPLALMHCTSLYPTPYDKVRLGAIKEMMDSFPGVPIGLSDHSLGIWTCLGAVAQGARILEKHFTITRDWPGPDISISIEPQELRDLIAGSAAVWQASGGSKGVLPEEQPVIDFAYASVVSITKISKGESFTKDNIWVKRPGLGPIKAEKYADLLGKTAGRDIPSDVFLDSDDIKYGD